MHLKGEIFKKKQKVFFLLLNSMEVQITDSPFQGSVSRHPYEVGPSTAEPGPSTAEPGPSTADTESVTQPGPSKGKQAELK